MTTTFNWSQHQPAEVLEEARSHRFRPEWRPQLLQYLGMAPGMRVLEVCCGPGTLAPYLAEGIAPGTVTGLDLDPAFIDRAKAKGARGVEYILGDACALPFPDNSFDAVTSYTGIGVLPDPERGLAEMIRVCRPGGTVSVLEPAVGVGGAAGGLEEAEGAELYPDAVEYRNLMRRLREVEAAVLVPRARTEAHIGSTRWPVRSLLGLLHHAGLEQVRLDAWGYAHSPDDYRVDPERRRAARHAEFERQMSWLTSLRSVSDLASYGFSSQDLERLITLTEVRHRWLLEHPLYDWTAGVSLVMAGRKPAPAEAPDRMPEELVAFLQEPRLVQLATVDPTGAPFVNVISWVLAAAPDALRLVGDSRTRFMQNLTANGRIALTVYGAGSAWTIYGTARVVRAGLPGLPPTFTLAEVTGLRVHKVLFMGAVLTREPAWAVTYSPEEAARFDQAVFTAMRQA